MRDAISIADLRTMRRINGRGDSDHGAERADQLAD
jgi:hypothetical protein